MNNPMNKESLQILYVGNAERGQALQAMVEPDWLVLMPSEVMEALAWYVFYMPDVVVLDAQSPAEKALVQETLYHLESVQAEPLLLIGKLEREQGEERAARLWCVLPEVSNAQLITAIQAIAKGEVTTLSTPENVKLT